MLPVIVFLAALHVPCFMAINVAVSSEPQQKLNCRGFFQLVAFSHSFKAMSPVVHTSYLCLLWELNSP